MVANKSTLALLLLFGGLALSAVLLAADLKFLGVMVGVIAVPAAFTALARAKGRSTTDRGVPLGRVRKLVTARRRRPRASARPGRARHRPRLAFGAGVLISAVAYELFQEASETAETGTGSASVSSRAPSRSSSATR